MIELWKRIKGDSYEKVNEVMLIVSKFLLYTRKVLRIS